MLLRLGNHREACPASHGGKCSCNNGAYNFLEVADLEAQLLKPGHVDWTKSIQQVKPYTYCCLENFQHIYSTSTTTGALDAPLSVGTAAHGQSQGTGNMLFWDN